MTPSQTRVHLDVLSASIFAAKAVPKAQRPNPSTAAYGAVGAAGVRRLNSSKAGDDHTGFQYRLIRGQADLAQMAEQIHLARSPVALDLKADGDSPFHGRIRLLNLALPGQTPWLVDVQVVGHDLGLLGEALQQKEVIGHDLKRQALWLRVHCGLRLPKLFCTMTASRLLTNGTNLANDSDACLQRHLSVTIPADKAERDWSRPVLTSRQLTRATDDARHLFQLQTILAAQLKSAGLERVASLEMALLPGVVEMEAHGVPFDQHLAETLLKESRAAAAAMERLLKATYGDDFNPNSPDQVRRTLAALGVKVKDTSETTLTACGHPAAQQILDYRQAIAPVRQIEGLLKAIAEDGRIHTVLKPTGAVTGRFTSESPSLQNIKRGALRRCFAAPDGQELVVADYSQIELRIAAECAGEGRMLEAFQRGDDLHVTTAGLVLCKPEDQVTKEDRQLAKAVNFGLIYGQSPEGLVKYARSAYGVALALETASQIHRKFFEAYPRLKAWHDNAWRRARAGVCEVRTVSGRRRQIPAASSDWDRFTALVNTPVQGGAADGLKFAMVAISQLLPASAHMILTVHDELVVICPVASGQHVSGIVQQVMKDSMAQLFPASRIEVEVKVCRNWGEK